MWIHVLVWWNIQTTFSGDTPSSITVSSMDPKLLFQVKWSLIVARGDDKQTYLDAPLSMSPTQQWVACLPVTICRLWNSSCRQPKCKKQPTLDTVQTETAGKGKWRRWARLICIVFVWTASEMIPLQWTDEETTQLATSDTALVCLLNNWKLALLNQGPSTLNMSFCLPNRLGPCVYFHKTTFPPCAGRERNH